MGELLNLIRKNKGSKTALPLQKKDIIAAQKELNKDKLSSLPADFIRFLEKCNGVEGVDSTILGIPPIQNQTLDLIAFNKLKNTPQGMIILGYDDFCFLVFDNNQEQYALISHDLQTTLETFEKEEWEDALLSIIHFDNV